ncbi:MAG TPA: hypothetical protein VMP01_10830 [Pirellulaceae bacterium]|nr:hypothetical protein [Pirellulaceae bacterium]
MNAHRTSLNIFAALLAATWCASASAADPPPVWELWPYHVQVVAAIDDSPLLPPRLKEQLPALLHSRIAAIERGTWKLEVTAAPADLRQEILAGIDAMTQESLPATASDLDKVILLAVAADDGGVHIRARELDVITGLWNATVTIDSRQADYVPHAAVRAVLTAFAPLGRIETSDGQTATLRMRASGLAPHGDRPLAGEAAFRPVLVECDAKGAVVRGKGELIDWTYLTATNASGGIVECRVQTALAGEVIPEYHPLRQRWALGVSRSTAPTKVRLVSRESDAPPLEGIEVLAEDKAGDRPIPIGSSDRRGEVLIPPGPSTVRTIVVRQGDEVLARLPLVPGLTSELTLPVSYDRRLIELEAVLAQLADDLIDAAARRAVLAARLAAAEAAGHSDAVATLKQQLTAAASVETFLSRLDRLQQSVQSASPATRRRLEPKLTELRKGIDQLR